MKAYIDLELEFEVDFDYQKEEPTTRHYPGWPAAIEVNDLFIDGKKLPVGIFNAVMDQCQDTIEDACWEELDENNK